MPIYEFTAQLATLEHIGQLEANFVRHPPAQSYGPGWGKHGNQRYRKRGFGSMFFSS